MAVEEGVERTLFARKHASDEFGLVCQGTIHGKQLQ
jgi:hypothetical protein